MISLKGAMSSFANSQRSVSYFNASGPVPLARLRGSEAYQSFIMDTLPGASHRQDSEAIKETVKKALLEIRDEARAIKGDSIRIGAISYPAHFESFSTHALCDAAHEFDENLNHFVRFRPSHYGAMLTYHPGYCSEVWGLDIPAFEDDLPLVLMFEHDFGSLRITLAEVGRAGTSIYHDDKLPWPSHQGAVESIIRKQVKIRDLAEIPAVIISSEEIATNLSLVPAALAATFPELLARIQVPIGGRHYVTSIGAACVARQIALMPELARDEGHPELVGHDEL
jgi:hypothetical protein